MHVVADCLHQVSLPKAHPAVDKQRVINISGRFRSSQCRCAGKAVVVSYNKRINRIFGIQMRIRIIPSAFVCFCQTVIRFILSEDQGLERFSFAFTQAILDDREVFFLNHGNQRLHLGADDQCIIFQHDRIQIVLNPGGVCKIIHFLFHQHAGRLPQ